MEKIILYYKYTNIENPEQMLNWQKSICDSLGLKGRIILATEGINGTLGGPEEKLEEYKKLMNENPLFQNIDWKESPGGSSCFPRLRIRIKNEIVHLGLDKEKITTKDGGVHLTPEQAHELMNQKSEDLVIIDTRNDYESKVGTFRDSLIPNTKNFREFPEYIDKNLDKLKDKKVLMFCTGGVRCERASAYVNQKEVAKEVYQIEGGIHRYIEKYPDGHFRGKNYVFDDRITVKVNDDILAECEQCHIPYDTYTNCINAECNRHIIICPECIEIYHNTCDAKCLELVEQKKVVIRTKPNRVFVDESTN